MGKLRNYYQLLDVELFASPESIRTAFRQMARKYHPDLNPGDTAAEEKFKELNEAYDVLTDPQKRAFYDKSLQFLLARPMSGKEKECPEQNKPGAKGKNTPPENAKGASGSKPPGAKTGPSGKATAQEDRRKTEGSYENRASNSGTSIPINELFENFIKKNVSPPKEGKKQESKKQPYFSNVPDTPARGEDVSVDTPITPLEAETGIIKTVHVQHNEICRKCSGSGRLHGVVCSSCIGARTTAKLKKMDVRIPSGVKEGSKVRVSGEGGRGLHGGDNGDLYLLIRILSDSEKRTEKSSNTGATTHPDLKIDGFHVHYELPISIPTAIFGAQLEIPTLNGPVKMTIPPLTSSGKVFRLKEMGVQNGKTKGDQFVTVQIIVPAKLSEQQRALYRELAQLDDKAP